MCFLKQKTWKETQKPWNDVKVYIFFHVQVNGVLISTFLNTLILILVMKKHPFAYMIEFFFKKTLLHPIRNYKAHHILHISQTFYSWVHNPWNYNMSQNCEKIFNSIINNESITNFLLIVTLKLPRLQTPYFIEIWCFWCMYLKLILTIN
jgi:hypothetical protein